MVPSITTHDSRLLQAFSDPPPRCNRMRFIQSQRLSLSTRERGEEANTSTEKTSTKFHSTREYQRRRNCCTGPPANKNVPRALQPRDVLLVTGKWWSRHHRCRPGMLTLGGPGHLRAAHSTTCATRPHRPCRCFPRRTLSAALSRSIGLREESRGASASGIAC